MGSWRFSLVLAVLVTSGRIMQVSFKASSQLSNSKGFAEWITVVACASNESVPTPCVQSLGKEKAVHLLETLINWPAGREPFKQS